VIVVGNMMSLVPRYIAVPPQMLSLDRFLVVRLLDSPYRLGAIA
jgi:hypothetical protein